MKDTILTKKRIINNIFTIIGLFLLTISISLVVYDYLLEKKAINMSALITILDYENGRYSATVTYKVEENTYTKKMTFKSKDELTVNDKIKIKYNIYNPDELIYNNHIIIIIVLFVISIVILILNLFHTINNIKEKLRINKLFKKGFYINATITEVIVNRKSKKNKGSQVYKLRCHYLNPINNLEYIFDSDETYINLNEVISKYNSITVVVIIDKFNTYNYYVDLESLYPKLKLVNPNELMKS